MGFRRYRLYEIPIRKKTINFNKNEIECIKVTGNQSGFQILATSALMIEPGPPESMLESFLSLSNFSKKYLDIDIHSMQLRTVTQMACMFYTNNSPSFNSISFISPIKILFQQLHDHQVRYGYLHSQKTLISEQLEFKNYLTLDFTKFYTNCLKNVKLLFNSPIEFENNSGIFKKSKPCFHQDTMVNNFFITLESICEGHFRYGLFAKEARLSSFPQDCIISHDGEFHNVTVLTFFGLVVIDNMSIIIYHYLYIPPLNPSPEFYLNPTP